MLTNMGVVECAVSYFVFVTVDTHVNVVNGMSILVANSYFPFSLLALLDQIKDNEKPEIDKRLTESKVDLDRKFLLFHGW